MQKCRPLFRFKLEKRETIYIQFICDELKLKTIFDFIFLSAFIRNKNKKKSPKKILFNFRATCCREMLENSQS